MDDSLLQILNLDTIRIKELSDQILSLKRSFGSAESNNLIKTNIEVCSLKLESVLKKVKDDLTNYFKYATSTDPDEISKISSIQLEAEELLCETRFSLGEKREEKTIVTGKLPKLTLPEFDGDILQWYPFWDQFSSNVDNRDIADVDKLLYLKATLKGPARQVVEGLESTNTNYKIAIESLKERYGKLNKLIDAHYSALNKIPSAGESVGECRRVFDEIQRHLRILQSLGENTGHRYLRFLITEKFPENLIYELRMKIKEDSIDEMRKELEIIISAKEDASRVTTKENTTSENITTGALHVSDGNLYGHKYFQQKPNESRNSERMNNFSRKRLGEHIEKYRRETRTDLEPKRTRSFECIFCRGDHYNDCCTKYHTIEDRKKQLQNRCFICLKPGHNWSKCRSKFICYHCKSSGKHNRALCPIKFGVNESTNTKTFHTNESGSTILQTAIIKARKEEKCKSVQCRILLDSGSQRTYITQRMAKELNLVAIEETKLTIFTFGSDAPQVIESPLVQFQIMSQNEKYIVMNANVVPKITHSVPHHALNLEENFRVNLADDGSLEDRIDILIGNDYYFSLISTEKIKLKDNLYLINSEFGWILSGRTEPSLNEDLTMITYFQSSLEVKLNQPDLPLNDCNISELWSLESIGIKDSPKEDRQEEAIKHFNETTKYVQKRYHVSWPWVEYPPPLTRNFGLALGRLTNLVKRLDSDTLQTYNELLQDQLNKGIIEKVLDPSKTPDHPIHYLPHHGIKQPHKQMRIVYDASSKTGNNKSLNECLFCGPIMLEDLTGLLLKFRCHNIGVCADVEKAFLQIGLNENDRDVTRFLWLKNINEPVKDDNIIHLRFRRMPFGIISSPFLLNATIKYHLEKSTKKEINNLANDIYVDNLVTGVETEKEAEELYQSSKEIFKELSMNLRDWSSNSKTLINSIPDKCPDTIVKVLGLSWDTNKDTLELMYKKGNDLPLTKRQMLKIVASVYDPCGFMAPSLLLGKLLIQESWTLKTDWDEKLPPEIIEKWKEFENNLQDIYQFKIERRYFRNNLECQYQLHCFTDASLKAYAAVIYISNGKGISFVIGKSKLAPIKNKESLSIPRLELLGILIGCRLIQYVLKFLNMQISKQILWSDSEIAIEWCKSTKLLPPFVARRTEEIRKNKQLEIKYIPSEINPADVATRPINTTAERMKWITGPTFLQQTQTSDFNILFAGEGPSDNLNNKEEKIVRHDKQEEQHVDPAYSKEKLDTYRFEENTDKEDENTSSIISEIKKLQESYFPEESRGKETHLTRNLNLFFDVEGLLRCKGRLANSICPYEMKYPILIPKDSEFTDNLIKSVHEKNHHVGASHTLSIIRQQYWIPHGKAKVQKIIKKCTQCVKHGGGPYPLPPTPALPKERANYSSPFTFTGIDYFGPMYVYQDGKKDKVWICLYTCLAVRAIHMEIVNNLSAEECLLALRRFISSRGMPQLIVSDNALQFKLAAEILENSYCIENGIKWKFIPELAPWNGGFYERLIGLVKNCLKRTIGKHLLSVTQLLTIIKEVEAVVNTRPLTNVGADLEYVLKPVDFLNFGRNILITPSTGKNAPGGTVTKENLIESWRKGQRILQEFKTMFIEQYLASLRERYRHSHPEPRVKSSRIPKEGDIVQIRDDSKNRENWKVGKISSLIKSSDGEVRVAKVKVGDKEFTRSLTHLYPLEMEGENNPENNEDKTGNHIPSDRIDVTISSADIMESNKETSLRNEIESEEPTVDDITIDEGQEVLVDESHLHESIQPDTEQRQKRAASTKALEKIRQWTQSLLTLL